MFKGSKKGNDGADEFSALLPFERFDVAEQVPEMILNPRAAAFAATAGVTDRLQQTGIIDFVGANIERAHDAAQRRSMWLLLLQLDSIQRATIDARLLSERVETHSTPFS